MRVAYTGATPGVGDLGCVTELFSLGWSELGRENCAFQQGIVNIVCSFHGNLLLTGDKVLEMG